MTARYVKERRAFGKPLMDLQNTRFKLAECASQAHIGRVFLDSVLDECLQLHGGYGYMTETPIARMWADSRVQRIYGGSNEIMKELVAWSL